MKHIHFIIWDLCLSFSLSLHQCCCCCLGYNRTRVQCVHTNDHFIRLTEHLCRSSKIDIMLSTLHMIVFTLSSHPNLKVESWIQNTDTKPIHCLYPLRRIYFSFILLLSILFCLLWTRCRAIFPFICYFIVSFVLFCHFSGRFFIHIYTYI